MLVALVFVAFLALVALLSRLRAHRTLRVSMCCGARPWPPDDLTGAAP